MGPQSIRVLISCIVYVCTYILFYSSFLEATNSFFKQPSSFGDLKIAEQSLATWGEHNLIFLFSIICASYFAGFASAGIRASDRKINLGLVWSFATSLVLGWYYFYVNRTEVGQIGQFYFHSFPVTAIVATLASPVLSYFGFSNGKELRQSFDPSSFYGINLAHLIWILLPLKISPSYLILTGLVYSGLKSNALFWSDFKFAYFLWLLTVPSIVVWGGIIFCVGGVLQHKLLSHLNHFRRFVAVGAIITVGCVSATALEFITGWIIGYLVRLIQYNFS